MRSADEMRQQLKKLWDEFWEGDQEFLNKVAHLRAEVMFNVQDLLERMLENQERSAGSQDTGSAR
jgi:hypothetical protein